jgi:hypothetical protein
MGGHSSQTNAAGNQFGATYDETEAEDHVHNVTMWTVVNGDTATAYIW